MTDLYLPRLARIASVQQETPTEKTFSLQLLDSDRLSCIPGQFITLSVFGKGEAPFCVGTAGQDMPGLDITVRRYPGGRVTEALHLLGPGAHVGLRGPFGNGFNLAELQGKDVLVVAGGIGLVPVRPLIRQLLADRDKFRRLLLLYGVRQPSDILYRQELADWQAREDFEVQLTIDVPHPDWTGNVGVITTLFPSLDLDAPNTKAIIVGPPVMYPFVVAECREKGIADEDLIFSLERHMKCGVGKCGHCAIKHKYVCTDGPVFTYAQIREMEERE